MHIPNSTVLFYVRYFPKGFSQMATSQLCNFPNGNFPTLSWPQRAAPIAACGTSKNLTYPLGSCRLRICTYGKLPLGKLLLKGTPPGENAFGKIPNTVFCRPSYVDFKVVKDLFTSKAFS